MKNIRYIFIFFIFSFFQLNAQEYKLILNPDSELLKSYQNIRADSISICERLEQLIFDLQDEGFAAASIDQLKFDSIHVFANVYIGAKYSWGKLNFELEPDDLRNLNLKQWNDKIFTTRDLQKTKLKILNYYQNHGYPFTQVYLNNMVIHDTVFEASIRVDKSDYYQLDSIVIKGEPKVKPYYIKKTLQLERGIPFNQAEINSISNKLSDVRFLTEVKPAEIEFSENNFDLFVYLKNKKANMFNGIIGFLPDPENERSDKTGKILVTGELSLNLINSFHRGEEIILHWEKLQTSTQSLDVGFAYPYLFKTDLGFDANFGLYKKDSSYLSLTADVGVRFFFTYDDYVKAYYKYKNTSRIGDEDSYSNNLADINSNLFGASYYLNELDYKWNPRKGIKLNLFAGAGIKNIEPSDNLLDSLNVNPDDKSIEAEAGLDLDFYFPIYNNFVFHFGNISRYLDQFTNNNSDDILFENELYRFGGAKSLRGFDENIFYASIYSLQNVEIKYLFEQNSSFYIFWNGAYYYKDITNSVVEDFPWGFGLGIDFETKAGIFSLSYALGKQFDNPIEIRSAKIHFGYVSRF